MPKRTPQTAKKKTTPPPARPKKPATPPATLDKKPAPNKARPPKPVQKQDVKDIDRADSEGMAQPQALPATGKKPAAKKPAQRPGRR